MGTGRTLVTAVGEAAMLLGLPATASAEPPEMFLSNRDEIPGWQWLRDADGCRYATWSFWGGDAGQPVTVTFGLLATDGMNGGPGTDARVWVTIGSIESGADGPAIKEPSLLTFPNVSAADDPVGYTTPGTKDLMAEEFSLTMDGLWVHRDPTGDVLPEPIAVNRDAVTVQEPVTREPTPELVTPGPAPSVAPSPLAPARATCRLDSRAPPGGAGRPPPPRMTWRASPGAPW